jgi:site-specific DNA-methyltransferase (adenine-specific)
MAFRNGQYEKSGNDLSMTPPELLLEIIEEFGHYGELFDPCPEDWDGEIDGLEINWPTDRLVFVNPPYSDLARWAKKCREQADRGCTIVLLIPPRTCTSYFHDYIYESAELRFIRGRVKFLDPATKKPMQSAPFPSMLCIWRGV